MRILLVEAEELLRTIDFDVACFDLGLPDGDGLDLVRRLADDPDLRRPRRSIVLTARDAVADRVAGLDAGADDYLVKPFSMAELLVRLRAVLRRAGRLQSAVWQIEDLVVDEAARTVVRGGVPVGLTRTEFALLALLGRERGRVLSKTEILSEMWGYDGYQPNVVEAHISSLRRKIESDGRSLIHTVRGVGYVLRA